MISLYILRTSSVVSSFHLHPMQLAPLPGHPRDWTLFLINQIPQDVKINWTGWRWTGIVSSPQPEIDGNNQMMPRNTTTEKKVQQAAFRRSPILIVKLADVLRTSVTIRLRFTSTTSVEQVLGYEIREWASRRADDHPANL